MKTFLDERDNEVELEDFERKYENLEKEQIISSFYDQICDSNGAMDELEQLISKNSEILNFLTQKNGNRVMVELAVCEEYINKSMVRWI